MEKMVEIAGKTLHMQYTINSLFAMEERAGMPLDQLFERKYSATRLLLWAGLVEHQPEITVQEAGELIRDAMVAGSRLEDIVDLCSEGLREAGF